MSRPDKFREIERSVERVLDGGRITIAQARRWLKDRDPEADRILREAARRITDRLHGRRIQLFAPLYFSNLCANNCLYCGFRRGNPNASRRVLTAEEIEKETVALLEMGHRRILLVASEDPTEKGRRLILTAARAVRETRANGDAVVHMGFEVAPGDVEQFREMAEAGVDSYTLFQETYDRRTYGVVHPEGPKRDYDWRIEAPDRALAGGIPAVGLGVLLGLGEPVRDTLALIEHARRIEDRWGRPPRTVSLPRIEPADGSALSRNPYHAVSDDMLLRLIAVMRIALPGTGIVLSSREPERIRDRALEYGITEMSAGSRTDPGGYTAHTDCSLAQFEIQDSRPLAQIVDLLRRNGYEPHTGGEPRPEVLSPAWS
ncbi:MAG: radical SAM protein [Candidatus Eisenbacteria bacterium]|nr:radical SAM protein [Candidatus Eisenbacteria bacterium]